MKQLLYILIFTLFIFNPAQATHYSFSINGISYSSADLKLIEGEIIPVSVSFMCPQTQADLETTSGITQLNESWEFKITDQLFNISTVHKLYSPYQISFNTVVH